MVAVDIQRIGRNHMEFMDFFYCYFYEWHSFYLFWETNLKSSTFPAPTHCHLSQALRVGVSWKLQISKSTYPIFMNLWNEIPDYKILAPLLNRNNCWYHFSSVINYWMWVAMQRKLRFRIVSLWNRNYHPIQLTRQRNKSLIYK